MKSLDDDSRSDKHRRWKAVAKKTGRCALCPPHDHENVTRSKRGAKKPRRRVA